MCHGEATSEDLDYFAARLNERVSTAATLIGCLECAEARQGDNACQTVILRMAELARDCPTNENLGRWWDAVDARRGHESTPESGVVS